MRIVDPRGRLHVELDCKDCSPTADEQAKMQAALEPLSRLAEKFPHPSLSITVNHHSRSNDYHVKTSLLLPGRTLFTGDRDELLYAPYARCIGKLVRKVEAYQQKMSREGERSHFAHGTDHEVLATAQVEPEDVVAAVEHGDFAEFRSALNIYEEPLRKRIGRWITRYPELQSLIGESLEISDIVEEVFLNAFDQFEQRPTNVRFGDWLENLVDPSIDQIARHPEEEFSNIEFARTWKEQQGELSRQQKP